MQGAPGPIFHSLTHTALSAQEYRCAPVRSRQCPQAGTRRRGEYKCGGSECAGPCGAPAHCCLPSRDIDRPTDYCESQPSNNACCRMAPGAAVSGGRRPSSLQGRAPDTSPTRAASPSSPPARDRAGRRGMSHAGNMRLRASKEKLDGEGAHPFDRAHAHRPALELRALRLLVAVVVLALMPRVVVHVASLGLVGRREALRGGRSGEREVVRHA